MFSGLHRKVVIVFTLSKTIISYFWTQSALTHTAVCSVQCAVSGVQCALLVQPLLLLPTPVVSCQQSAVQEDTAWQHGQHYQHQDGQVHRTKYLATKREK